MPSKTTDSPKPELSFEEAMGKLEKIVEQMESDQIPLEELIVRYEEGIQLVQICTAKLDSAERRIEIITRNAAGKPKLEEMAPGKTPAAPASSRTPASSEDVSLF